MAISIPSPADEAVKTLYDEEKDSAKKSLSSLLSSTNNSFMMLSEAGDSSLSIFEDEFLHTTGKSIVNVVPFPALLLMLIFPSSIST